jgi:Asp-tRNA(Asn)/Glu-tRNA(Gln) amidotransferase A subunit family amidase
MTNHSSPRATALEIAAAVQSGAITALEVVEHALAAAQRLDPVLHFLDCSLPRPR